MEFLDLFSGIGGFRLGMEMAGHECVGHVEWDKYARITYGANFNIEGEWTGEDITNITDGDLEGLRGKGIDVICGGFPCQAFSVAGKRGGFNDTRGTLFFEIARIAKQIQPRLLLLENVKGLLSHDKGNTFGTILNTLDELGYDCEWQVLNSKNFGVPQNRERVFIIGHLRGSGGREVFPVGGENENSIEQIGNIDQYKRKRENPQTGRIYSAEGLSPTLSIMQGGGLEPKVLVKGNVNPSGNGAAQDRHGVMISEATKQGYDIATEGDSINLTCPNSKTKRGRVGKGIANTLDTQCNQATLTKGRIRKLTPLECFRLQGFPDSHHHNAVKAGVSNSQLYKQAGNSVTVNVVYEIAKKRGNVEYYSRGKQSDQRS